MIGWLWRMLVGRFTSPPSCQHKWQEKHRFDVVKPETRRLALILVELHCSVCGEVTTRRVEQ